MKPEKELQKINDQLDELLTLGTNDEKLVDRKRELEKTIRESKK